MFNLTRKERDTIIKGLCAIFIVGALVTLLTHNLVVIVEFILGWIE